MNAARAQGNDQTTMAPFDASSARRSHANEPWISTRRAPRTALGQARYALYFSPEYGSPWWALGAHWLGRCPVSNCPQLQPDLSAIGREAFAALTAAPRRYGFHATLKAPMRLAEPYSLDLLRRRLTQFAASVQPFVFAPLAVTQVEDFLALVPSAPMTELQAVADRLVIELDDFRAPLSPHDRARYALRSYSDRQRALMQEWGYPFVFDQFRAHFTLTGSLVSTCASERTALLEAASTQLARVNGVPLMFDAISLFREAHPGEPFRLIDRFPLGERHPRDESIAVAYPELTIGRDC